LNNPKTYISAQQRSAETEKLSTASLTASKTACNIFFPLSVLRYAVVAFHSVNIDAIYIFSNAFCPCILSIYGRLVRLVRCNVSTDPSVLTMHQPHWLKHLYRPRTSHIYHVVLAAYCRNWV